MSAGLQLCKQQQQQGATTMRRRRRAATPTKTQSKAAQGGGEHGAAAPGPTTTDTLFFAQTSKHALFQRPAGGVLGGTRTQKYNVGRAPATLKATVGPPSRLPLGSEAESAIGSLPQRRSLPARPPPPPPSPSPARRLRTSSARAARPPRRRPAPLLPASHFFSRSRPEPCVCPPRGRHMHGFC